MAKKKGRPKKISPIAQKIRQLVNDTDLTYEKICVHCDLKYPTLMNIFARRDISYATMKALKYGQIINEDDELEHNRWIIDNK